MNRISLPPDGPEVAERGASRLRNSPWERSRANASVLANPIPRLPPILVVLAAGLLAGPRSLPSPGLRPQDLPPLTDYSNSPPGAHAIPDGEAGVLHTWTDKVFLGFDTRNRMLLWNHGRGVLERHDGSQGPSIVALGSAVGGLGRVVSGALNGDRSLVATVSATTPWEGQIRLWRTETGEPAGPQFPVSDVAQVVFSPDGKFLVGVVARDGTLRAWDAATATLRWNAQLPRPMQTTWLGARFSPDGRHLAARHSFGLQFWNLETRQALGDLRHQSVLGLSADWKLGVGTEVSRDSSPPMRSMIWNLEDPARPSPLTHRPPDDLLQSVDALGVSNDGRRIAIATREQRLRIWSLDTRTMVEGTQSTKGRVMRVLFSPDDRKLAICEFDPGVRTSTLSGKVQVWDLAELRPLGPSRSNPGTFWDWHFSPDSQWLAVAFSRQSGDLGVQVWRLPEPLRATRADSLPNLLPEPKPAGTAVAPVSRPERPLRPNPAP